jgi:quinol-cytochrome oxidoreductase complex cytochrome b subunit
VEPRRTAVQRTLRVLLVLLAALLFVLIVTGTWLSFRYQPSGFVGARPQSSLRVAHRVASTVFLFTALATFGMAIAVSFERALKRGTPAWVVGLVLVVGALAASFTGHLLPWEQLALAPARAGEYRGYAFLFGHAEVKFVLIASAEVIKETVRTWFLVHTVAIPIVLAAVGVVGWRVTRRSRVA